LGLVWYKDCTWACIALSKIAFLITITLNAAFDNFTCVWTSLNVWFIDKSGGLKTELFYIEICGYDSEEFT